MKIVEADVRRFDLKSDPSGEAFIIIGQATFGETRKLADLTASQRQIVGGGPKGDRVAYEQDFNVYEERAAMIFLTAREIGGFTADVKNAKTSEVEEVTLFQMITPETGGKRNIKGMGLFQTDLDKLPDDVVDEMHEYVLTMNPQWRPNARRS